MPTCWIIAGPNGAGKTTFALEYLPQVAQCSRFINADLIAAGLSPLAPERGLLAASRLFLSETEAPPSTSSATLPAPGQPAERVQHRRGCLPLPHAQQCGARTGV